MKTLALFIISVATLVACSPNAQLVTLRGSNVKSVADEGLVLDNDTLTIRYNFASERGQMHLTLINKLSQPLYVDWKRSSFIIGQDKVDYWQDVADVNLTGSSYSSGYSRYSIGNLNGVISKENQVGFIPPQTKLEKRQFVVLPSGNLQLTGPYTVEQEEAKSVARKKTIAVNTYAYSIDQSPLTFRNYLTLSTDKDFRTEFHIDTKFWASDVKVLPRDQIVTRQTTGGEYQYSEPVPFKKADSFYVVLPVQ
ncbi:hypothetical protein BH09BAC4_BH09BAC4_19470 [soil metagenome]